ncbi:MAG: hypothetical protein J7L90_03460 [Dehalococcoidia bacterium]|nr:hypothetical protein [Dehalococcoidia bacterium]
MPLPKPNKLEMSLDELINDTSMRRPHVVILGAGASLAACQNGDKNGSKLPEMRNLIEIVGLDSEL